MTNIDILDLERMGDSQNTNDIDKSTASILLDAINDWPYDTPMLNNYMKEVIDFIGGEPTKKRIDLKLTKINYGRDAWKAESLSQLVEIFKFYTEGMSLNEIIGNLKFNP